MKRADFLYQFLPMLYEPMLRIALVDRRRRTSSHGGLTVKFVQFRRYVPWLWNAKFASTTSTLSRAILQHHFPNSTPTPRWQHSAGVKKFGRWVPRPKHLSHTHRAGSQEGNRKTRAAGTCSGAKHFHCEGHFSSKEHQI